MFSILLFCPLAFLELMGLVLNPQCYEPSLYGLSINHKCLLNIDFKLFLYPFESLIVDKVSTAGVSLTNTMRCSSNNFQVNLSILNLLPYPFLIYKVIFL